jgi:hypothetical protein
MPTSVYKQIPDVIDAVLAVKPASVLEIGIGCGKYGVLLREYLDVWDHYLEPWGQRHTRIDGIEIHEQYRGAAWGAYDLVRVGDARTIISGMADCEYGCVLIVDVLEHFEREDGLALLREMKRVAADGVVIALPSAPGPTIEVWDNPHEIHRAQYTAEDFASVGAVEIRRHDDALVVIVR